MPDDLLAHQLLDGEDLEALRRGGAGDRLRDAKKRITVTADLEPREVGLHRDGVPVDDRGRRLGEGKRDPGRGTATQRADDDEEEDATTQSEPHYTTLRSGSTLGPA